MNKTFYRWAGAACIAGLAYAATTMEPAARISVALAFGMMSFMLMILSRRQLGKSFSVMPAAKELVTTGIYSRIQHPMYVFIDLFLMCVVVAIGQPLWMLAVAVVVAIQVIQAHREEHVLLAAFGPEYNAYESRVWI